MAWKKKTHLSQIYKEEVRRRRNERKEKINAVIASNDKIDFFR